jgi:prevent-host-death family protein
MDTVGAFDAKTHFSALLERVENGEEIVIAKHGRPVARLVPFAAADRRLALEAIDAIKSIRRRARLRGLKVRTLIDAGRR